MRSDGTVVKGAIEQQSQLIRISDTTQFLNDITIQAAGIANERGQIADAVLLYYLGSQHENVISILNRALADAVTLDLGESPVELQPLKSGQEEQQNQKQVDRHSTLSLTQSTSTPQELARNMELLYTADAAARSLIAKETFTTFRVLLRFLEARSILESPTADNKYYNTLSILGQIDILPLNTRGSIPDIRAAAAKFSSLNSTLSRCAGVTVLWAIGAISEERAALQQQTRYTAGNGVQSVEDEYCRDLGVIAKDLMVFAGLVKYKLPTRVYDMLTRAGGEIGAY